MGGPSHASDETAAHEKKTVVPALLSIESIPDRDLDDAILTSWQAKGFHSDISFRQVRDQATLPLGKNLERRKDRAANGPTGTY